MNQKRKTIFVPTSEVAVEPWEVSIAGVTPGIGTVELTPSTTLKHHHILNNQYHRRHVPLNNGSNLHHKGKFHHHPPHVVVVAHPASPPNIKIGTPSSMADGTRHVNWTYTRIDGRDGRLLCMNLIGQGTPKR